MERGSANPAAIIHSNPGNRVNGTRKSAFDETRLSQLNSPHSAMRRPRTMIHFGSNLMNAAGIDTLAISTPNATENPDPPRP